MADFGKLKPDVSWRNTILTSLQQRNKCQNYSFQDLVVAHNRLFETTDQLKADNIQLSVHNERLRMDAVDCSGKTDRGDVKINEKISALEQKLFRTQEELTELHRRKGDNAQSLIDLRNVLLEKEKELASKELRLTESEHHLKMTRESNKNMEQNVKDTEAANQMLKDEYQALQLAFSGLEERYRKVQDENRELVERWMKLKANDADRLNEENEVMIRKNRLKVQKELDAAARELVTIDSNSGSPPTGSILWTFQLPNRAFSKFDAHEGEVQAVQWGPRGRIFATGGSDRKVKLWEVVKGGVEPRGTLRGSNAAVTSVDFNSEEDLILGTSNDFASRVWTVADQRLRHTLTGHSGRVLAAKFLGESSKVVSGSHDRTLKIWDLRSLACIRTIFTGSSCNDVIPDRAGSMIMSCHFDKRIRFWDIRHESSANEVVLQNKVTSLDLSPDGNSLLSCVRDNTLKLLDLRMTKVINTFSADGFWVAFDWTRAVFTPDGQYVTVGSQDGTIYIWSIADPSNVTTLKEHGHAVAACSWQNNGSSLASCDRNKQVVIWTAT